MNILDKFTENGYTLEEMKMVRETKKMMGDESIEVTAASVRIPVVNGHSKSMYVEFKKDYDLEFIARSLLKGAAWKCCANRRNHHQQRNGQA